MTSPRAERTRAEPRDAYDRLLAPAVALVALLHALVATFFVVPVDETIATPPEDVVVIDLVPKIPPPPEEKARPAEPILSEEPVDEEITIAPTEIVDVPPPVRTPDVPTPPVDGAEGYGFTPYTVAPSCREGCGAESILSRLPTHVRRAGVSCSLTVGLKVDPTGAVEATELLRPSGQAACDRAALAWARETVWTTAYNRDQPVTVWIAQPVTIRAE
ncbi:MAG: TonB family protein [Gemmatimonadota bacterium]|nr:TonB family protein [Gemmatimonadota bacterium]